MDAAGGAAAVVIESLSRENLTNERMHEMAVLIYDGFGSKRCCLVCGNSLGELDSSVKSAYR
eukprot:6144807-Amphidinium_carterae.1